MKKDERKELENKAYDIIILSMEHNGENEVEILESIHAATDEELRNFLEE